MSEANVPVTNEKPLAPRKERSKSRDLGKRMGGGQKGQWSNIGEIIPAIKAVDEHDPNYDSEEESNVILVATPLSPSTIQRPRKTSITLSPDALAAKELAINPPPEIKRRIIEIIEEYLSSSDVEEVQRAMKELNASDFHYEVVKRAITMSMDKHEKEREMVSKLLSELYLNTLSNSEIEMGFRRVLLLADDLAIDIPTAKTQLAIFCGRAIVDEILPPKFLEDPFIQRYAPEIATEAIQKLSINHGTARMEKAWGPGDGRPVEELKIAIDQLTTEYLLSHDLDEAARCVRELNVPHFHHELVKRGIKNSMEEGKSAQEIDANGTALVGLLTYLVTQGILSLGQLLKGFQRFKKEIPDVELDIPSAKVYFEKIVQEAVSEGVLPSMFTKSE